MKYFEEKYLLYFYKDLYKYRSVKKSGLLGDNKYELLKKYLKRIDKVLINNDRNVEFFKNKLFDKYIIRKEEIPMIKKSGELYSEKEKEGIISNQKQSLSNWYDYLFSSDLDCPMWIRFFIFKSVLTLGNYDYASDKFCKRSKRTINAFPIFNKKAVDKVIFYLKELSSYSNISESDFNTLVENGSFNKLYSKYLKHISYYSSDTIGIWKTYRKDEYKKLNDDLKNMTVDWCIKRGYEASEFLEVGDIKVFYTADEFGDFTIPRLCIREVFKDVVEVRGVKNNNQDVEDVMLEVLQEELIKYKDLNFYKKASNLKKLRDIYKKFKNGFELNKEELKVIYEIDEKMYYFGINSSDNRISEIKKNRNKKKDIAYIFDLSENDIATSLEDLKESKKLFLGDIKISDKEFVDDIIIPKIVIGNLIFPKIINSKIFENLDFVSGRVNFLSMKELDNLNNLSFVRDFISFGSVEYSENLYNLSKNNKVFINGVSFKHCLSNKIRVRE